MITRETITQITVGEIPDGMGGSVPSNDKTLTNIECKASLNTSPEVAAAYGLTSEKILYVVTAQELNKEAFYLFNGKRYTVRFQTSTNRHFYSTLIEVKEEEE